MTIETLNSQIQDLAQHRDNVGYDLHSSYLNGVNDNDLFEHFLEVNENILYLEGQRNQLVDAKIHSDNARNYRDDSVIIVAE